MDRMLVVIVVNRQVGSLPECWVMFPTGHGSNIGSGTTAVVNRQVQAYLIYPHVFEWIRHSTSEYDPRKLMSH